MHVLATGRTEKRATLYALRHGTILADLRTPCDISECCSAVCQFWRHMASTTTKGLIPLKPFHLMEITPCVHVDGDEH